MRSYWTGARQANKDCKMNDNHDSSENNYWGGIHKSRRLEYRRPKPAEIVSTQRWDKTKPKGMRCLHLDEVTPLFANIGPYCTTDIVMKKLFTVAAYSWSIANNFVIDVYCRCLENLCQIASSSIHYENKFTKLVSFGFN